MTSLRPRAAVVPALLGVVAFAVSFAFSWVPSPWGDESASVLAATRPWASLGRMLTTVDAVHGTYYALLHVWIDLFGQSMTSIRLPSALAVGAAAAGIVVLCRRLGSGRPASGRAASGRPGSGRPASGRVGVVAALVFAVLPRTQYMGGEARSYALSAAVVVWVIVLAVWMLQRPPSRRTVWLGWALAVAATIAVFLYAVLALVGFGLVVLLWSRSQDPGRTDLGRWARWSLLGLLIASPVLVFAVGQRDQISFLGQQAAVTPWTVLVAQWFGAPSPGASSVGSVPLAVVGWAGILVGVAVAVRRWRRVPRDSDTALLPAAAAAVVVIPLVVLLVADLAGAHVYTVRYLSFATPFVAILLAVAVDAVAGRIGRGTALAGRIAAVSVVAVLVVAVLAAPADVAQRQPYAKDGGSDWAEVAAVVGTRAHPGDAVVFDEQAPISRRPRAVKYLYPADFVGLADVTLATPHADTSGLRDVTRSLSASRGALARTDGRLWFVDYRGTSTVRPAQLAELARLGYRVTAGYRLHRDTVYRLARP